MARRKASRSRPSPGGAAGRTGGRGNAGGRRGDKDKGRSSIPWIGIDPTFFTFRARDARGMAVQIAGVAGLGLGLFVSLSSHPSTSIGGSGQITQFAYLVSLAALLTVPIVAAAAGDAALTWLGRRGALPEPAITRVAFLVPVVLALLAGLVLPPVLFAIGGQWLYLGAASVALVLVIAVAAFVYLTRGTADGEANAPR